MVSNDSAAHLTTEPCLLWVPVPDPACGEALARRLLDRHLAACVNMLPAMRSFYRWQGEVAADDEAVLVVKTSQAMAAAATACLVEAHPYELPCVLQLPVAGGYQPFVQWLCAEAAGPQAEGA
ncbi:MAG: divalent-cation tolerance protein CutA [Planctomycetota bacterium]|nr:MAG: divalent-cation tolerance protein CutA [Planctomycetota bacterium]